MIRTIFKIGIVNIIKRAVAILKYDQEIQAVLKIMSNEKNTKMFKRYQAIYLMLKGHKYHEIANIVQVTRRTIINYVNAFKKDGLDGLIPVKPTGQPKFLTDKQELELKNDIVNNYPVDFEFTATYNWTVDIVREHIINKFNVTYSNSGANKLLHV